jgi:hypothetical protein
MRCVNFASLIFAILAIALAPLVSAQDKTPKTLPPLSVAAVPATPAEIATFPDLPLCVPVAQSGYPNKKCLVRINRQGAVSPPPLIVPGGTEIFIQIENTRWNESAVFALATTQTTAPDVLAAALKNAVPGLQTLAISQSVIGTRAAAAFGDEATQTPDQKKLLQFLNAIDGDQKTIAEIVATAQRSVQQATVRLTCLSSYQMVVAAATGAYCSQASMLDTTSFGPAKDDAITSANAAGARPLPIFEMTDLDARVKDFYKTCITEISKAFPGFGADDVKEFCGDKAAGYANNEARINSAISDVQKAQSALLQTVQVITSWPGSPATVAYKFTASKLKNMVVTISGQEIVTKTNSPIATVTINPQANPWVISLGLAFSNLTYHTYTNAPIIKNGQPVLDMSGKTLTVVTQAGTSPSVIAPEAFVSYRLRKLSGFNWENRCRNGCSFLLTGGVGANLTSKTADFDTGVSFQIGGFLLTPTIHFCRDARLSNGVKIGDMLGSSPPSTLPTENAWVKKFGLALTYTIPTP